MFNIILKIVNIYYHNLFKKYNLHYLYIDNFVSNKLISRDNLKFSVRINDFFI